MARKTVAELLVDVLDEAGIERVYGVPGDSLNGITDSIRVRQDISWIGVRHEETAAFAARHAYIWAARYLTMDGKRRPARFLQPWIDG